MVGVEGTRVGLGKDSVPSSATDLCAFSIICIAVLLRSPYHGPGRFCARCCINIEEKDIRSLSVIILPF